jgi:DNA-binding protein HU-beta
MARKKNTDFFSSLRSQGIRKSVARALSDIESSGRGARGNAEKAARRVIADLRSAADNIEQRLDIGGAGTHSRASKKAATTRKRAATKRSSAAKKGAAKRARKTTARTSTARKLAPRKTTARKTTARKSTARKRS